MSSDRRFAQTMLELSDTLVSGFDIVDFLHTLVLRCAELLDASDVGLMLADLQGGLKIMAYTSERAHGLEYFELVNQEGPCLDCFNSGETILGDDLETEPARWPRFAPAARELGFRAVQALPLRCRDQVIGALNVFHENPVPFDEDNVLAARAMADIATIGLLQERAVKETRILAEQLQVALNGRLVIEQAKGVIAERTHLPMDEAFELLRTYARANHARLGDVANSILAGSLTASTLLASHQAPGH